MIIYIIDFIRDIYMLQYLKEGFYFGDLLSDVVNIVQLMSVQDMRKKFEMIGVMIFSFLMVMKVLVIRKVRMYFL